MRLEFDNYKVTTKTAQLKNKEHYDKIFLELNEGKDLSKQYLHKLTEEVKANAALREEND